MPEGSPRLAWLGRLRTVLRSVRQSRAGRKTQREADSSPADLWAGLEYLVGHFEARGVLHEDLIDRLATACAEQAGEVRFDLQCRLASALADRRAVRFVVALRLATRMPVPQARTALLEMLTLPEMARWAAGARPAGDGSGTDSVPQGEGLDLRPAVIAALGQLRDPSLLNLFHRLLEKLSGKPVEHTRLIAAVQWSLMNLAPGGTGEPVPASILSIALPGEARGEWQGGSNGQAKDGASMTEAMRVVSQARGRGDARQASNGNGVTAATGRGPTTDAGAAAASRSERDELLS